MYSKVSKYSPEARKRMTYRSSKGKSCGYYMRIVFFFSSLIQSLIIVSLVLFLVYGKQQDTASVARVQDLELRFSQLSLETVSLRQQRKNLTHLLNVTSMERARNEWDLARLRFTANISYMLLDDTEKKLQQCNLERRLGRMNCPPEIPRTPMNTFQSPFGGGCNLQLETLRAKMELIQANFTQTAMQMQMEMDQISRDRDNLNLEAIQLRRDKSVHEKAIQFYQIKCKEEFVNSLSGISNVSKAFLTKIDSLFHALSPFHLTCPKQKDYLDQIRTNCSDLSDEVVTKFQTYLDTLGNRVSMYQGNISVLTAENMRMTRDYNLCSQNRTGLIREHKQHVQRVQLRNDEEKEKLLKEKIKLKGDIEVLESSIKLKNSQLEHMNEQLKHLNLSCIPRTGGLFPRLGNQPSSPWGAQSGSSNQGFSSSNSGLGQFSRNNYGPSSSSVSSGSSLGSTGSNTGLGLSNSGFNKLGSSSLGLNSGLGSSSLNKPGLSSSSFASSATGLNKQTSPGLGSSLSSSSLGSSGTGLNKQTSLGLGSSWSGLNKQTSPGLGSATSSSLGSTLGSFNNPSSSSSSLNKLGSSASAGASTSSLGSKLGSSSSNFGLSSNSGLGSPSSSSSSKTTTNSRGSSNSFFSSSGSSSGSTLGSSSSSQNKLSSSSNSKDSSSSSSSGSSATTGKSTFGGWWGLGGGSSSSSSSTSSSSNSNSDQSKLGSNQGRGPSTSGNSFGSLGSGRTNTFSFTGPISVNQHLRDLQRIINPPGPEEKQELSRIMG